VYGSGDSRAVCEAAMDSTPQLDVAEALRCARFLLSAYARRTPPRRLVEHYRHLELLAAGCSSATDETGPVSQSELIGTAESARILGCTPAYVRRIAASLDGRRVAGNSWVFDRKAVEDYGAQRDQRRSG
jgi:hypothetical protein